ncbi:cytoplasmic leucine-tRNA ligase Lrs1 [Schizosaccharomyces cryophilus OY26]|uniref:leucine--tRNA ligase n=1 Tax=Schizosaccharomyces cryophilus (strain OY26 / ATCC MYA-4695 / CBS 11777 / NBRC 106824 / NRRL Y48691) TaxID=653667 RepID=S9WZS2_SCHCR|nr:cytoplasmic leucine-tRNA ligase Lrs1 [Schizosaccharomyces cryophilus OY26]EPY50222.1 cytoplasmic leucine-tRNA ligase Lrs1 [Schizosaccharomyces cryophilus OY26]
MEATNASVEQLENKTATLKLENTTKRDTLIGWEKEYQKKWEDEKVFEANAPLEDMSPEELREKYPKFFGNMPYPYMNGSLHLGHAFTLSKVEFTCAFERLKGKRVLFPMGFHCTGMPICASADKLSREMEMFGPNFIVPEEEEQTVSPKQENAKNEDVTKHSGKKSKAASKTAAVKYQFQIMESLGIPRNEISKFADAKYWLEYFPPLCRRDCTGFGLGIDWRRSFMTTDANPYYDSFVRWQVNHLHKAGKIKFGERYTVYSIRDGQPCMDHDRKSGEGLGPQEYTGLKMQVLNFPDAARESLASIDLSSNKVYMIAATLRPETMYGQTNCYVGPSLTYGVYEGLVPGELYICTRRAASNMAYQGLLRERGVVRELGTIKGQELIGARINAPLSVYEEVYVLPMESVLPNKGTGVVTSVPSDSPDDYATLGELRKKAEFYHLNPDWMKFDPIPIIRTPSFGDMCAEFLCKKLKIQSPKDVKQLAEAKELAYKECFYQGTMITGDYNGEKVEVAKPKVRADLIKQDLAFVYNEPEGQVISRSGDDCIVALCDQWFLDYGEANWKAITEVALERLNTFSPEVRNGFKKNLDWLSQWACARSYGLGTRLPWDPQFLVESLTDSTIYMAFYTIAHLLQGSPNGSVPGALNIKPEQMTPEVWDYVFRDSSKPVNTSISDEALFKLRREFQYFYPFDIRASGKDLIPNHLTFCLYTHTAIFDEKYWPKGIRANGHLLMNGEKMSKSTGNFMTLHEASKKFGADATRLALADAGDTVDDANFEEAMANSAILRLYTQEAWCREMIEKVDDLRTGAYNYHDSVFDNEINLLIEYSHEAYSATAYKAALKNCFYDFQNARDWYREVTADRGMHRDLVMRWIEAQVLMLAPFTPHWSEHLWLAALKKPTSIHVSGRFPRASGPVNSALSNSLQYVRTLTKLIREAEAGQLKRQKKGKGMLFDPSKPKRLSIFVADKFPEWQAQYVSLLQNYYNEAENKFDDKAIISNVDKKAMKVAMPFIQQFKQSVINRGEHVPASSIFSRELGFNELDVLQEVKPYLIGNVGIKELRIVRVQKRADDSSPITGLVENGPEAGSAIEIAANFANAVPGQPTFLFENVTA